MSLNLVFPNLAGEGYTETRPATRQYNCVAWAAGRTDAWWWPDAMAVHYWPDNMPREETLEAFVLAFATLGYVAAGDALFEAGFEKVALYARSGKPTHVARQQTDGTWTSKLGEWLDITHTLRGLEGPVYGQVSALLKRTLSPPASP